MHPFHNGHSLWRRLGATVKEITRAAHGEPLDGANGAIQPIRLGDTDRLNRLTNAELRGRIARQIGATRTFKPTHLAIETTNACNADCIMCPYSVQTRTKGMMKAEAHKIIIDKIRAWDAPIDTITHAGLGDPLLDKRLEEKIAYEKVVFPNAQTIVYTNAGLLTEARAHRLLESPVDVVSVSINGFHKETYEKVMKISRDVTYSNVARFDELRRQRSRRVKLHVSLIKTDLCSPEEIHQFVEFWKDKVDNVVLPPWISWGNFLEKTAPPDGEHIPCFYIWKTMMIDHDGTVKLCCEDYDSAQKLGNILTQEPDEIFNSPRMQQQRDDQLRGDFTTPSMCRNCVETQEPARVFWYNARLAPTAPRRLSPIADGCPVGGA